MSQCVADVADVVGVCLKHRYRWPYAIFAQHIMRRNPKQPSTVQARTLKLRWLVAP